MAPRQLAGRDSTQRCESDRMTVPLSLVTGAGGALGQAIVRALLARGAVVVGVDRNVEALQSLPDDVHREVADLTDPDAVTALFDRVAADVGTPGAVVHTVGGFRAGAAVDSSPEDYRVMMQLNVDTAWWIGREAGRRMRATGGGAIVAVGAQHGVEPVGGAAAYAVSKGALVHLIRVLDVELRSDGIRVNAVLPRLIDTPANRAALPEKALARAVTPDALAGVIAFLVSTEAAPVVGAVIPVYGAL
jgi:NAD(P)-dependent dehydrogenase (short-subunit alcohol dehydrogenase family)